METIAPNGGYVKPRRTVRSLYKAIDVHAESPEAWPGTIPDLTSEEAVKAGRQLYRRFYVIEWYRERGKKRPTGRKPIAVKVTSGNRYSRIRSGTLYVNPEHGWRGMVHSLSHTFHYRLRPNDSPHSDNHRSLEREMIGYVIERGWLDGKLKPEPKAPKPTAAEQKRLHVEALIKAWETKARRADTALKKLRKQKAYYDRRA